MPSAERIAPILDKAQQDLVLKGREWLQPTKFRSAGSEYAKHVRAYIPGTGAWIRKSPEFQRWRGDVAPVHAVENPDQPTPKETGCLWVKGVPGSGKSVFSASVVHLLEEVEPETPVLFFFFRQIVQRNHDPQYLVRDFVAQLLPYSSTLRADIQKKADNRSSVLGYGRDVLWDALLRAFDAMDKVYCVIDALDEMDDQYFDFISTLRELGLRCQQKIKVLLTSRPVPKIEAVLRHQSIVEVKLQPSMMYPDIVRYVNIRLGSLIPRLSPAKEQLVRDAICERAQGLFLHARIITDNLTENLKSDIITEATLPDSLECLPSTLKDVYEEMLNEHAARSGVDRDQQVRILSCVVNASRPLRSIELGSLIAQMRGEPKDLQKGKELVREGCGCLLEILEDESVSVLHHSFTEFLRDVTRQSIPGAFPVLDTERAHRKLAVACLEYLDSIPFQRGPALDEDQPGQDSDLTNLDQAETVEVSSDSGYSDWSYFTNSDIERTTETVNDLQLENPLMEYAISNWEHHVKQVQDNYTEVLQALHRFLVPGRSAFELWAHRTRGEKVYDPKLKSIHLASHVGLLTYATELLDADPTLVDAMKANGGLRPLSIAAREGQLAIAKLLLDRGAKPDCADNIGWKPMHYCTSAGHLEVVKLLLERGVRPQTETTKYSKNHYYHTGERNIGDLALDFAFGGWQCDDIVKAFVPYLRPEDATRCLHRVRKAERLESILKTGFADVNSFHQGITKIFEAAASHDAESVELLLKYGADPNKRCTASRFCSEEHGHDMDGHGAYPNGPMPIHAFAGWQGDWSPRVTDPKATQMCLKLLLDAGADINASFSWPDCRADKRVEGQLTPLHCAVMGRISNGWDSDMGLIMDDDPRTFLARLLIENGADVHAQTLKMNTPAHLACAEHPGVFDVLARNGADLNKKNDKGRTPILKLLEDSSCKKFSLAALESLLSGGADVRAVDNCCGDGCLHYLMRYVNKEKWSSSGETFSLPFFRKLVTAGADLNKKNHHGVPPLHFYERYAPNSNTEEILRGLVEDGLDINARDSKGLCILGSILSHYTPDLKSAQMFVRLGADVNARDNSGESLLHKVIQKIKKPLEWLQFLITEGADYMLPDPHGYSLIQLVMTYSAQDTTKELIDYFVRLGVSNSLQSGNPNELHIASAFWYDPDGDYDDFTDHPQVGVLSEYRVQSRPVDETDKHGATPLHYAASIDESNVGRLLKAGADPTRLTNEGASPLHIAAVACQPSIVGLLLSEYKKRGVLRHLLDLQDKGPAKRTALHYACRSGYPESVRYLISHGADVHAMDARGLTPLQAAMEFPQESRLWETNLRETVRGYLVHLSDDFRPKKASNRNYDWQRGLRKSTDIVSLLAGVGVDLNQETIIDGSFFTPLDMAIRYDFGDMVRHLLEHGVRPRDEDAVAMFDNQPEVEANAQLLQQISIENQTSINKTGSPGARRRTVLRAVCRLLENGKYSSIREFVRQGGLALDLTDPWCSSLLRDLASRGHVTFLRSLQEEFDIISHAGRSKVEEDSETLLGEACRSRSPNLSMIKLLVEEFSFDVNEISFPLPSRLIFSRATPLHFLALGSHWWQMEAIEYLLERGADIEARNYNGQTPLLVALTNKYPETYWIEEIVSVLLHHGADPNVCGNHEYPGSCLEIAGSAAVTRLLLDHGADASGLSSLESLTHAATILDVEMAQLLIEAGQDVNFHARERYPLHEAAHREQDKGEKLGPEWIVKSIKMCKLLLSNGANPFRTYADGTNILQAIIENHGVTDSFFEIPGLDVEHRGREQRTLLISACVPSIMPWDGTTSTRYRDSRALAKPRTIIKLLKLKAMVDAVDEQGRTALHWLCTMVGELSEEYKESFNALLERSTSLIHVKDDNGATPFHLALASRQTWVVRRLMDVGADIKEADHHGNTALHHYAPDLVGEKPLAEAAAEDFSWLLSQGLDIDARNHVGETPLFVFSSAGWEPPRQRPTKEDTVFHDEYLGLFIEAGADVGVRNKKGETLLHVVAGKRIKVSGNRPNDEWNMEKLVSDAENMFKKFLDLGVDPRVEDDELKTAIDCAVARGREGIVRLFKGEGKKVDLDEGEDGDNNDEISEPGYEMIELE